jgi:hypothetical protein
VEDLSQYYAVVDAAIKQLGVDPENCRGKQPGQWNLRKGSARIWIDLWHIHNERRAYFQAMSPVMPLPPERREEFFRELLETNDKLFGVAFAVYDNWAWLKSIREVEGMNESEALNILKRIGIYADDYDDKLMAKYNVRLNAAAQTSDAEPEAPIHPSIPPNLP